MKIVVAGLGRMGMQICRKLVEDGHQTGAYNRSPGKVDTAVEFGAIATKTREAVVDFFGGLPVILWLMIPAEAVDSELEEWLKVLPANSIVVDGGNSDFRLTQKRAQRLDKMRFVDIGVSGGILGMKQGFSMMAGGDKSAYDEIKPALESMAKPRGGYEYFGQPGSGHFVKMVHNAIEYGMMESLAEGYRVLKEGPYNELDLAAAGQVWQKASVIESTLNGLAAESLAEKSNLEGNDGVVSQTGETKWTLETAKTHGVNMPAVEAAFDVRLQSQKGQVNFATKLLAEMRNRFGGHQINPDK